MPLSSASAVAAFAEKHSFRLTDYADVHIASAEPYTPTVAPRAFIDLEPDGRTYTVAMDPTSQGFYADLSFMQGLQGRVFDRKRQVWLVASINGPELFAYALRHSWEASPEALALANRQTDDEETSIEESLAVDAEVDLDGFGPEGEALFPFQRAGVAYAAKRLQSGGVLIADEMGLGKTLQAIATAWFLDTAPVVVVCPAALKRNWQREFAKWLPQASVSVLAGKTPDMSRIADADVVIINYDVLGSIAGRDGNRQPQGWIAALAEINPQMLVVDEAHYAKNEQAKRTRALIWLSRQIPNVLLLTGTPVVNRPVELVPLLRMMGRLQDFGGPRAFKSRYCAPTYSRWGTSYAGATNLDELNKLLRSTCYVRRTKAQVMPDLPPKLRSVVDVDLSNRSEYELAERHFVLWLMENGYDPHKALRAEHLARLMALRRLAVRGKIADCVAWVREFLDSTDDKLVLFAHHVEAQNALAAAFPGSVRIAGGQNDANDRAVQQFQSDPSARLIVVSLMAGQAGFTLHAASHVAFLELGWTPKDMRQAEDRVHRIGQTAEMVNVYWLLCANSIDTDMEAVLNGKAAVVDAVTDGEVASEQDAGRAVIGTMMRRHQAA